jgi:hypothetical protein
MQCQSALVHSAKQMCHIPVVLSKDCCRSIVQVHRDDTPYLKALGAETITYRAMAYIRLSPVSFISRNSAPWGQGMISAINLMEFSSKLANVRKKHAVHCPAA